MKLRFPAPRSLGRLGAALWALAIHLLAWAAPLAFAALLYGFDALFTGPLHSFCTAACHPECGWAGSVCSAGRWYASYWWVVAGILAYPLWLAAVVWLVRRVAAPGYRWRLAGFMVCFAVLPWLLEGMSPMAQGHADAPPAAYVAVLVVFGCVLAIGLWMAFRPLPLMPGEEA